MSDQTQQTFDIGFTGTRKGLTDPQSVTLKKILMTILRRSPNMIVSFHHGDCVGADSQAHDIMEAYGGHTQIIIHPPDNDAARTFRKSTKILKPEPYLVRNRCIVEDCDILIACPEQHTEVHRSGTWSTVRKAQRADKGICVIFPCGGYALRDSLRSRFPGCQGQNDPFCV